MNSPVERSSCQIPMMAHAQAKDTAEILEALNGTSAEPDIADVTTELEKCGGRESGDRFEERLKEIDMEMGRFDKLTGVLPGVNIEEEIVGMKE